MSQLTHFQIIPDFNAQSAKPVCYFSNLPKQPDGVGKQSHEVDEFILRGPEIAYEGFLDIRGRVITDTARELYDYKTPEEYEAVLEAHNNCRAALLTAKTALKEAEDRVNHLVVQTAEMITKNEALYAELEATYEDHYPIEDDDAAV